MGRPSYLKYCTIREAIVLENLCSPSVLYMPLEMNQRYSRSIPTTCLFIVHRQLVRIDYCIAS